MLLIETTPDESDDDLRVVIDSMLAHVWDPPQTGLWHEYDLGRVFEFSSRQFREFRCIAGIASAHLMSHASKTDLQRALISVGVDPRGNSVGEIIAKSQSQPIDPTQLRHAESEST